MRYLILFLGLISSSCCKTSPIEPISLIAGCATEVFVLLLPTGERIVGFQGELGVVTVSNLNTPPRTYKVFDLYRYGSGSGHCHWIKEQ